MNNLNVQMHVPEHIYVDGGNSGSLRRRVRSQSATSSEILTVPERITLGGGGTHYGAKADPSKDSIRDKIDAISVQESSTVPLVITVSEMPYRESHAGPIVDNPNHSSSTIDENPVKELKVLRRRLGHISTRLIDLEEESARRQTREFGLWAVLAGAIFALTSLFLKRKR